MTWCIECLLQVLHIDLLFREDQFIGKDDRQSIDYNPHNPALYNTNNRKVSHVWPYLKYPQPTNPHSLLYSHQHYYYTTYNNQLMLRKIRDIPIRYYQLALLNIGLQIALYKQMSLISIFTSLVFVALALAPFGVWLGLLSPPPHQIVRDQILHKMRECHNGIVSYLSQWESLKQQQKQKAIIYLLLALYISTNYICPCIQTFVIVNVAFAYLFMGEEVEWIKRALCRLYQEKCPVAK